MNSVAGRPPRVGTYYKLVSTAQLCGVSAYDQIGLNAFATTGNQSVLSIEVIDVIAENDLNASSADILLYSLAELVGVRWIK
jgi:hypothetical protein